MNIYTDFIIFDVARKGIYKKKKRIQEGVPWWCSD